MRDLTEITAPVDGTVLEVADRSTGSVLREAETLVTLVSDGADLYVEANVPSRDVSYLKIGDAVRVKLEAYPFQRFGTANGVLNVISADSVPLKADDAKSELVYKTKIRITDSPKDLAKRGIRIRPGLVASAEIKTGKRSIASYILNPVLRTADESAARTLIRPQRTCRASISLAWRVKPVGKHGHGHSVNRVLSTFAGLPAATARAGMLEVTTAPAPITAPSPMVTLGRITVPAPRKQPSPISTYDGSVPTRSPILLPAGSSSKGWRVSTITQAGVIETRAPILTRQWQTIWTFCSILVPSPIRM